ncbi:unnamed protein product [Pedinophyceae sp. YPF-701]|nr:unnamed protein product [Pedinophyceae sp. YPF-701]
MTAQIAKPADRRGRKGMPTRSGVGIVKVSVAVGIDLGTTNSMAHMYRPGRNPEEVFDRVVPSVVLYEYADSEWKQPLCGADAEAEYIHAMRNPMRHVFLLTDAKRLLARYRANVPESIVTSLEAQEGRVKITRTTDGFAVFQLTCREEGQVVAERCVTPQEVLAEVLRHVRVAVEQHLNPATEEVGRVAVGIPHGYDDLQREATIQAARMANFDRSIVDLIPEPVAAGFTLERFAADAPNVGDVFAVLDLGGGTLDVTIMRVKEGGAEVKDRSFKVLTTHGDNNCGGRDLDEVLRAIVEEKHAFWEDKHGIGPKAREAWTAREEWTSKTHGGYARRRLTTCDVEKRKKLESLKIKLSGLRDAHITWGDHDRSITVTRQEFQEHPLSEAFFRKVARNLGVALQTLPSASRRNFDCVSRVLLVGGSAFVPGVKAAVESVFKDWTTMRHPMKSVSEGAAWYARRKLDRPDDELFDDVVPYSLGLEYRDSSGKPRLAHMISKDTELAKARWVSQDFYTADDDQSYCDFNIHLSPRHTCGSVAHSRVVGKLHLPNLPPGPKFSVRFGIEVNIDQHMKLHCTAWMVGKDNIKVTREIDFVHEFRENILPSECDILAADVSVVVPRSTLAAERDEPPPPLEQRPLQSQSSRQAAASAAPPRKAAEHVAGGAARQTHGPAAGTDEVGGFEDAARQVLRFVRSQNRSITAPAELAPGEQDKKGWTEDREARLLALMYVYETAKHRWAAISRADKAMPDGGILGVYDGKSLAQKGEGRLMRDGLARMKVDLGDQSRLVDQGNHESPGGRSVGPATANTPAQRVTPSGTNATRPAPTQADDLPREEPTNGRDAPEAAAQEADLRSRPLQWFDDIALRVLRELGRGREAGSSKMSNDPARQWTEERMARLLALHFLYGHEKNRWASILKADQQSESGALLTAFNSGDLWQKMSRGAMKAAVLPMETAVHRERSTGAATGGDQMHTDGEGAHRAADDAGGDGRPPAAPADRKRTASAVCGGDDVDEGAVEATASQDRGVASRSQKRARLDEQGPSSGADLAGGAEDAAAPWKLTQDLLNQLPKDQQRIKQKHAQQCATLLLTGKSWQGSFNSLRAEHNEVFEALIPQELRSEGYKLGHNYGILIRAVLLYILRDVTDDELRAAGLPFVVRMRQGAPLDAAMKKHLFAQNRARAYRLSDSLQSVFDRHGLSWPGTRTSKESFAKLMQHYDMTSGAARPGPVMDKHDDPAAALAQPAAP